MKKFINHTYLCILLAILCLCTACGNDVTNIDGKTSNTIRIATAGMTGSNYSTGAMIAMMINEKTDNMEAFVQATNGAVDNIKLLQDGEVEIGYCNSTTAVSEGILDQNNNKVTLSGIKSIGTVMIQDIHIIVNKNSNINSIEDLRGCKISVGSMGSGIEVVTEEFLEYFGIKPDEYSHIYGSTSEAFEQVSSGDSDCYIAITTVGGSNIVDCFNSGNVKLLNLSDNEIEDISDKNIQYTPDCIPAGTYANQDAEYQTLAAPVLLLVRDDLDEELVYNFCKALFENHNYLAEQSALLIPATPENTLSGNPVELHPGVIKYLTQIGLWN